MLYKTHRLQVRCTDEENERLERIVKWLNHEDWQTKRQRRDQFTKGTALSLPWGAVTVSDVLRWLIKGRAVDVLHARISKRTTPTIAKRSTRISRKKRSTR